MSRYVLWMVISFCLFFNKTVEAQDAKTLAIEFFNSKGIEAGKLGDSDFTLYQLNGGKTEVYEIPNLSCFVVLQKERNHYQIVGYSTKNRFSKSEDPDSLASALLADLDLPRKNKTFSTLKKEWPALIQPLTTSQWGQSLFFNRFCPHELKVWNGRPHVGCVAVAMGQILHSFGEANSFLLEESYQSNIYGTLTAWSTGYEWSSMLDQPLDYELDVSRLLSDLGILVHTNYSKTSSAASTGMALKGFQELGYSDAYRVYRRDYGYQEWMDLLYSNLAVNQPVFVAGGGHAFVCDGYDENGFLHFNLGGSGIGDGYYSSEVIYGFSIQEAIVGLMPDKETDPPEELRVHVDEYDSWISWRPPEKAMGLRYRIYFDNLFMHETEDTIVSLKGFEPGQYSVRVSSVSDVHESIRIGPVDVLVSGEDFKITDPVLIEPLCASLKIRRPSGELLINESDFSKIIELDVKDKMTKPLLLSRLFNLQKLSFNAADLDKESLSFLLELHHLQSLTVSNISLEDLPEFRILKKLVRLRLVNPIGDEFDFLSSLPNLKSLEIINADQLKQFPLFSSDLLEELIVNRAGISSFDFVSLFPNLRFLDLSQNDISRLNVISELHFLQDLNLDNNHLTDLGFLRFFPNLSRISARNNELTSLLLGGRLDLLYELDLSGNNISDVRLPFDLPELCQVNLSNNSFEKLPGNILLLKKLRNLNLSHNSIRYVPQIASQYLNKLDLSKNKLSYVPDLSDFVRLNVLDLSSNQFSDLSPFLTDRWYTRLKYLDIRNNPISLESFNEQILELSKSIVGFYSPESPQLLAPCFPLPGKKTKMSSTRVELSWYSGGNAANQNFEILIGEEDSLISTYTIHNQRSGYANFQKGQVYNWQIKAVLPDTAYYSGIYEIRTLEELELPHVDDFEGYIAASSLTTISHFWRISTPSGDTYRDARIVSGVGSGGSKALYIDPNTDITLDLDHVQVPVLKVSFSVKVINHRSAHFLFSNINGIQMEVILNDGLGELWLNASLSEIFDYPEGDWVDFELSIIGKNNRLLLRRNSELVFSGQWEFPDHFAHIDKLVFGPERNSQNNNNRPIEYYLDNVEIKTAGTLSTDIIEIENFAEASVYPNPASDYLNLSGLPGSVSSGEMKLIRMDGSLAFQMNLAPGLIATQISLKDIPTGLYLCQVIYPGRSTINRKIIIQSSTL